MKKVAIVTINGNYNYGNRLQNYALKRTLENYGCYVTNLWFITFKEFVKDLIKKCPLINSKFIRYNNFSNFTKRLLNVKYCSKNYNKDKFDYYVVGSDQVWNYNFPTYNTNMFLPFSIKSKNFSYAGSFGVGNIDETKRDEIKDGLNNLNYISVREYRAKEIVEDLTGREDVEVVIDPTMLLDAKEWDRIIKKPKGLDNHKYILNYFLGELSHDKKEEIEKYAKKEGCIIINILDYKDSFYNCGPEEFLYLEKNAHLICTDSFHSSVFAILFQRPFVIFDREDNEVKMNSRIDTLLETFCLENRKYGGKLDDSCLECNYVKSYKILETEREKAEKFLKHALNMDI